MLIWILAVLLVILFAGIGVTKGAIRMSVSIVGLFLAIALAVPLGPLVAPLVPLMKVQHPILLDLLPPVIVFILVNLVVIGFSFYVHRRFDLYFKYKTDDVNYFNWNRMNRRLGGSLGALTGVIYTVLLGVVIYVFGYASVQTAGASPSTAVGLLNRARADMECGLDRVAALFDPAPEKYYETADVIGLMYHNPRLMKRFALYPDFLGLAEEDLMKEVSVDTDYLNMIQTQAPIIDLLNHEKTRAILQNPPILTQASAVDLDDLTAYLHTGKSEKYADERLLGRWRVNVSSVVSRMRRKNPTMTSSELIQLKKNTSVLNQISLTATPNERIYIKLHPDEKVTALIFGMSESLRQALTPVEAKPQAPNPSMDGFGDPRYGQPPGQPEPAGNEAPSLEEFLDPLGNILLMEGTWESLNGKYRLTLTDTDNRQMTLFTSFENERLILPIPLSSMPDHPLAGMQFALVFTPER